MFFSELDKSGLKNTIERMKYIKTRLEEAGARVFLSGGTLLGAVRENDFIPWDWDIEYMVLKDGFRRNRFIRSIQKDGCRVKQDYFSGPPKIIVSGDIKFEIFEYGISGEYYKRRNLLWNRREMRVPAELLENPAEITFKGMDFLAPSPVEEYLTWRYGNWREPLRLPYGDASYLTRNFEPNRDKKKLRDKPYLIKRFIFKPLRKPAKILDRVLVRVLRL